MPALKQTTKRMVLLELQCKHPVVRCHLQEHQTRLYDAAALELVANYGLVVFGIEVCRNFLSVFLRSNLELLDKFPQGSASSSFPLEALLVSWGSKNRSAAILQTNDVYRD